MADTYARHREALAEQEAAPTMAERAWLRFLHAVGTDRSRFWGLHERRLFQAGWDAHAGLAEVPHLGAEERARLMGPFCEASALVAPKRRGRGSRGSRNPRVTQIHDEIIDAVACPSCGAACGDHCVTRNGHRSIPHVRRRERHKA